MSEPTDSGHRLSSADAEAMIAQVADLSSAGGPLADGLRAAAAESSRGAVASALRQIAGRLDQGVPLKRILEDASLRLPGHVRGLVAASVRTGRLGLALEELVEHHRTTRAIWWGVVSSVAYPLIVLGLTVVLLAFCPFYIVPQFKTMFVEFDLELPVMTQLLINASDLLLWVTESGRWVLLGGFLLLLVCTFLMATGWGGGALQRVLTTVPFVGPLWLWSGSAAGTRLLAILVDYGVPLPEALRLTAAGVRSAHVRETCLWLADGVEGGSSLSSCLRARRVCRPLWCRWYDGGRRQVNWPRHCVTRARCSLPAFDSEPNCCVRYHRP